MGGGDGGQEGSGGDGGVERGQGWDGKEVGLLIISYIHTQRLISKRKGCFSLFECVLACVPRLICQLKVKLKTFETLLNTVTSHFSLIVWTYHFNIRHGPKAGHVNVCFDLSYGTWTRHRGKVTIVHHVHKHRSRSVHWASQTQTGVADNGAVGINL